MQDVLFLIDGFSLFYQSFYALPGFTASDGRSTGAVYGVARLLHTIEARSPKYVAVAFDTKKPTFRHEAFKEYKATRRPMPPDLAEQLPLLKELLALRGVASVSAPGFEADDVIGTLAHMASQEGVTTQIISRDKDLKQLLGPNVKIFDVKTGESYGPESFRKDMGIDPGQFPDFLGIAGDTSDNIPGIAKIGPKKAQDLLIRFGTLEEVLGQWQEIAGLKGFGKKTAERIRDGAEQARLSRMLGTIRADVPLGVTLDDLSAPGEIGKEAVALYRDLGFQSLIDGVEHLDTTEGADYGAVTTPGEFAALLRELRSRDLWAFDLETTSLDPLLAEIAGIAFSWETGMGRYVPFLGPGAVLDGEACLADLAPLFADSAHRKVGQNLKFDVSVLKARGVPVQGIWFDTLLAAYLLNSGERNLGLDALAGRYLNLKTVPLSDLLGEKKDERRFDEVDLAIAAPYACEDADVAMRLYEHFMPLLKKFGLWDLFTQVEMPLVEVLSAMELTGIALDPSVLEKLRLEVVEEMTGREKAIYDMAGEEFNIGSPAQLRPILFSKLGLPVQRKTKTGPSTATDVLEELAPLHPLPGAILAYRQLAKLRSTYIEVLPGLVHERSGRVHGDFNQAVTATGRLSSSRPNLQNIPVRTETGRRIREAFVAGGEDQELLTADYSQVELRMLAHLSGDQAFIKAFRDGRDIHREVAAQIFSVPWDDVDSEMRRKAKAVNFGLIYGQTPFGLSRFLSITMADAGSFIETYFQKYPQVREYFDRLVKEAEETRRVRTILGRMRGVPDITSSNRNRRAAAERTVLNTAIQGSAADLIKVAMVNLDQRLRKEALPARLLVQIHDELLLETKRSAGDAVQAVVVQEMEGAMDLSVPLQVDCARGSNWRLV
jgi:DNA polymerase-1